MGGNAGHAAESCIKDHEQSHINDYERDYPGACKNKPAGSKPRAPSEWVRQSECKAYAGEEQCEKDLQKKCRLKGDSGTAEEVGRALENAKQQQSKLGCNK